VAVPVFIGCPPERCLPAPFCMRVLVLRLPDGPLRVLGLIPHSSLAQLLWFWKVRALSVPRKGEVRASFLSRILVVGAAGF